MSQATQDISVIICAYTEERWNELVAAVESVRQQTLLPREIIIVIDRNPSLLLHVREKLSGVVAVENSMAKGASGARNSGAAVAQGTILAFLDDDAIAHPVWLENLVACYTSSNIAGVGGKIEPLLSGKRPSWFPDEFNWVIGCSYLGMPIKNTSVRNVIGANMSVRKDILISVDGFRESFGNNKDVSMARASSRWFRHHAGDEETEFCIRVTQQLPDSEWLYTPSAVVQHQIPVQRTRWSYFLWRCYDEGLGKASLSRLHGLQTGLSSERTYVMKALPRGFARGLIDVISHRDLAGLSRAGAIVIGLTMTAAGYLVASISFQVSALRNASIKIVGFRRTSKTLPPIEAQ